MKIKAIFLLLSLVLTVSQVCAETQNGVIVTEYYSETEKGKNIEIFSDYSLSTTWGTMTGHSGDYDYAESDTASGWFSVVGYPGKRVLQIIVDACSGLTLTFKLYGRLGDTGNGALLLTNTYTAPGDYAIPISENMDWYRLGANISAIGTDTFSARMKVSR